MINATSIEVIIGIDTHNNVHAASISVSGARLAATASPIPDDLRAERQVVITQL